jgi:hypothetical protein
LAISSGSACRIIPSIGSLGKYALRIIAKSSRSKFQYPPRVTSISSARRSGSNRKQARVTSLGSSISIHRSSSPTTAAAIACSGSLQITRSTVS